MFSGKEKEEILGYKDLMGIPVSDITLAVWNCTELDFGQGLKKGFSCILSNPPF